MLLIRMGVIKGRSEDEVQNVCGRTELAGLGHP